ncbi:MAG TPA: hypothetical protein DCX17_01770, partial [Firmicutes bacterium]|nr:hypothetical protein [Bacillota bacterium]
MFFYKKNLIDLEKRYEHSHALFMSHDKTIIDRLALIANRNILYGTIHDDFDARFEKIKSQYLGPISGTFKSLEDMVASKNNKGFKNLYEPARNMINNFEKDVDSLTKDLEKIMRPEEDTRALGYSIKEEIRHLKELYRLHQDELSLIEKSFERLFANIDASLNKIDELIEIADYQEASLLINKLKRLAVQVDGVIKEAPTLAVMIQRVIPDKIKALKDESERLVKRQYPLHHLMLNVTIDKINDELMALTSQLSNLDITGIHDKLRLAGEKIETFYAKFELEKEAKVIFDEEYQTTYKLVNDIERAFVKLNATLPQIRQYYVLGQDKVANIEAIRQLISKMNMTKRGLDTLVLSATRQPYSLQVDIIKKLKIESAEASQLIADFNHYLSSLKTKSDEAFQLVNVYYLKLKHGEDVLSQLDVESLQEEVAPLFDDFYDSLRLVFETLKVLPIDIGVVEAHVDHLKNDAEALINRLEQEL